MLHKETRIRILHWTEFLVFVLLPLLLLPGKLSDLKFRALLQEERLEECVSFQYGNNRNVVCYTPKTDKEGEVDAMGYVFLPSFSDLNALYVETSASFVDFVHKDEHMIVSEKEPRLCSFEENEPYTVHFYDYQGKEAGVKTMTFLKSGNLPTLYVDTETGNMEQLDKDKEYKEAAYAELIDSDGKVLFYNDLRNISSRGNHTFQFDKKSYQIKLSSPENLLDMGLSDTWILLCNVYDPSYIRNKLTYDMALEANMPGSPKSEYVDVYFNDVYSGMYLLCEKIEIGENRLELADLERQNQILYGGDLDTAYRFRSEDGKYKGVALQKNPEDITGGYLIEHDYDIKYEEEISGFVTEGNEQFVLKSPQHASMEQIGYIAERMQDIETAIMTEDGCNPDTGEHFSEYIDLESWADKYLVEEITRNNGGGLTSSYFYKPPDTVSTRIFGGPVWDYDKAYGRIPDYSSNIRQLGLLTLHITWNTRWFAYLYEHEEFVQAVKEEYKKKFCDYLTVMAEEKIEEYLTQIRKSSVLDQARFAYVYREYGGDLDFQADADRVAEFILERKEFLDQIWLENEPVIKVHFLDQNGVEIHRFGVIKGECIGNLPWETEVNGRQFAGWRIEGTENFFAAETPVTKELTVVGVWE